MNLLGRYENGNYKVHIFDDGTKIRETDDNEFISTFPECMDVKITDHCDMYCFYCHENSSQMGKHGDILNAKFIDTIHPYTEMAIGGGNPLSHPDLFPFLYKLKKKNIIANITVSQSHFLSEYETIDQLINRGLVKGVGVSLSDSTNDDLYFHLMWTPNVVVHTIAGITSNFDYENMADKGLKVLILGYKYKGRGKAFYSPKVEYNISQLELNLSRLMEEFDVVSFDNLAIKQLNIKSTMNEEEWNDFYMGDDGQFTMYIDLVKQEFAKSSVSEKRYALSDSIDTMFATVKNE